MKVVTKYVNIENREFVLIKDKSTDCNGETYEYYGTIPYEEINEQGRLKRLLNGFDMCIADTANEAIVRRENDIKINNAIMSFLAQGYSKEDAIMKAFGF